MVVFNGIITIEQHGYYVFNGEYSIGPWAQSIQNMRSGTVIGQRGILPSQIWYSIPETNKNKSTTIDSSSTDATYPSSKAVYDAIQAALLVDEDAEVN